MSVRILEVHAASAEVVIDRAGLALRGIGPVREPARANAAEDRVELGLADQKRVVIRLDLLLALHEVEAHAVVGGDHGEVAEARRSRKSENLAQKLRGARGVTGVHDRVVELY